MDWHVPEGSYIASITFSYGDFGINYLSFSTEANISFQMGYTQQFRNVSHLSFLLSGWSSGLAALNENPSDFDLGIEGVPPLCSPSK